MHFKKRLGYFKYLSVETLLVGICPLLLSNSSGSGSDFTCRKIAICRYYKTLEILIWGSCWMIHNVLDQTLGDNIFGLFGMNGNWPANNSYF
ncbi:hypothetical protein CEK26_011587 [Fusarium fujikuroi]|uniref:Uncharacterized protein n=1 Tax=Fusarium fujikuroi TaxID=5127 RepID=A0A5Q3DMV5_FUSFU|nr:hypothetical protein CEK27_011605 [Fusarium fujikuroi]QGI84863.1 hypothetical protein CEK25_011592 [Fusarium fujikuroi]QGI98518.1 hypothetical protein CEK26_011587 [Fusarium fujikuroi]VTT56282.1 unnamed protein product [Fusarium fujikuroi]VTT58255.1 unnamed protein product [Fusarium fujikuroi]